MSKVFLSTLTLSAALFSGFASADGEVNKHGHWGKSTSFDTATHLEDYENSFFDAENTGDSDMTRVLKADRHQ